MFEERIAAMNQRTEETMAASAGQFDKRTYTVDEIQDILGISRTSAYNLVKKKVLYASERIPVYEVSASYLTFTYSPPLFERHVWRRKLSDVETPAFASNAI